MLSQPIKKERKWGQHNSLELAGDGANTSSTFTSCLIRDTHLTQGIDTGIESLKNADTV